MPDTGGDRTVQLVTGRPAPDAPDPRALADSPANGAALPWLARRVVFTCSLLLVSFIIYSSVEGMLQASNLDPRIAETREEIAQLRLDSEQLAALIAWLNSDAYIERIAREDLGMVRPGEEAFAVHAPRRSQLEITRTPWWANLLPEEDDED